MMDQQTGSEQRKDHRHGHHDGPPVAAGRAELSRFANVRTARGVERVFGYDAVFVQTEVTCDRANEAAIECPAGQLIPAVILDGFQKLNADARGRRDFIEGNSAHLAFPLEVFAERCGRHSLGTCEKYRRRWNQCQ
jgi:hypothetical protein